MEAMDEEEEMPNGVAEGELPQFAVNGEQAPLLFQLSHVGGSQPFLMGPPSGPNAPPPSSCGTGSEHSLGSSACPSPGPMKRFRQIYGNEQPQQPTTGTGVGAVPAKQQRKPNRKAMNWTENWIQSHHCASQPSTSSAAPSIVSATGSAVTQLSALSVDTQLSVAVDLLNLEPNEGFLQQQPTTDQSLQPSAHIENVDPSYFHQMHSYLTQIVCNLSTMDESLEHDAICRLYRLGKEQQFVYCSEPSQVMCQIIQRLVEIILRPNTRPRSRSLVLNVLGKVASAGNVCLGAIRALERADRGFFLNAIILCLRSDIENDARYATNILSTLFTHPVMGEFFRRQARTQHVIRDLMMALQQDNYGFRHRFLRHIYLLIRPSKELKRFFHQSNGMHICLDLFQNSVDEPMLHACASLVLLLIDDPTGSTMADHFVRLNGIQILAHRLDHGSPRLLLSIARCLASASDSDQLAFQSIDDPIRLSIQLLASTDGELVKYIIGFLANIQAKNSRAKTIMQTHEAIPNLLFLLSVWSNSPLPSVPAHTCSNNNKPDERKGGHSECEMCRHVVAQKSGIDELIDTVLLALCNLTNGVNVDPIVSCLAILDFRDGNSIVLFHQLLSTPELCSGLVRIRLLTLLSRMLTHLSLTTNILHRISTINSEMNGGYIFTMLGLFSNAVQKIVTNPSQQRELDRDAKTIIAHSLGILKELVKHHTMFKTLEALLRGTNWNPFLLLCSMKDEKLELSLSEFLCQLSLSPGLLAEWTRFEDIIRFCAANLSHIIRHINIILTRLMKLKQH